MWTDPIIEELHAQRREHAIRFGFDPHKIFSELRKLDETPSLVEGAPLVTLVTLTPKTSKQRIVFSALFVVLLGATSSPAMADSGAWAAAIFGGIQGAAESASETAKKEREAEKEKELIRYRYQLEQEREQRRAQEELRQRQEESQKVEKARQEEALKTESARQEEKQKVEKARQEKEANSVSTGSGFFITSDGYFITNYHVIKNSKSVILYTTDGLKTHAVLVRADTVNDLVILKAEGRFSALPVASSRIAKRGQSVATVGYPHADVQGIEPKVTEGIISSLSGIADDPRMFQISVPIQSGNSGGPLITREGNVVGIIVSKLSAAAMLKETGDVTQNVNYAIKSNYLIELIETAELKSKPPLIKRKTMNLEEVTAAVERSTALVVASTKPFAEAGGLPTEKSYSKEERKNTDGNDKQPEAARPEARDPAMVRIPGKNYEMGKYEVTQGEWKDVMGSNPSYFSDCGDTCPVEVISWNDAQAFIQKLNAKTGKQYRLPTEAEWEYACYGGSRSEYCGGNDLNAVAWADNSINGHTHPVGEKQANGYGLHDMSGNVGEWMNECWFKNCEERTHHAIRGGSWMNISRLLSVPYRYSIKAEERSSDIGFRLARTLP